MTVLSLFSEQFTMDCLCLKKAPYFALKTNTIHIKVTCRIQLEKGTDVQIVGTNAGKKINPRSAI